MDRVFIRNFLLFMTILLLCAGTLTYGLIKGDKELSQTDALIEHTYDVINESEQLSGLVEGMLAAQRGYIISGQEEFYEEFDEKKAEVSDHIAKLSELTGTDKSQQSRLAEFRNYFLDFSKMLEERAAIFKPTQDEQFLTDLGKVDSLRDNLVRINSAMLDEEYEVLNERLKLVDRKKSQYLSFLMVSLSVGTILLLVFNGFLLMAQRRRSVIEASLKDSEERFVLAIEGTEDGIFDWDIKRDKTFYSRRFFEMLGYDYDAEYASIKKFIELVHPDDEERVWSYLQNYVKGMISEYNQEFRIRHKSGRWVWVLAKAKGLFDKNGEAYRVVGAHTDITHLVKAREKLEAEKHEAEEANRLKSEFLAHMSHEIRTPLTAINGIAEILTKNQDNLDKKQKKLVSTLSGSANSLHDLVNDVLDFSRIESGEVEIEKERFVVDELFQNIISMMSLRAAERGIDFVFEHDEMKGKEIDADQSRLRQILVNLIGNAIKFTDKGEVKVVARFEDHKGINVLRIDVKDTGIGISEENMELVFERFKQADSSVSRKYGGTGLGLPISKNLAKLMEGDILLESEIGKGSTFSLIIPTGVTEANTEEPSEYIAKTKVTEEIKSALNDETKVLVVEDYEGNVVVLSYLLDELGLKYDVANNGKVAVDLWTKHHYDLILMDIQMPEMDGFTATKKIRTAEDNENMDPTPIIGMTAHALVGDKDKCIEAGMDAYLPKPIVELDFKKEVLKQLRNLDKAA